MAQIYGLAVQKSGKIRDKDFDHGSITPACLHVLLNMVSF